MKIPLFAKNTTEASSWCYPTSHWCSIQYCCSLCFTLQNFHWPGFKFIDFFLLWNSPAVDLKTSFTAYTVFFISRIPISSLVEFFYHSWRIPYIHSFYPSFTIKSLLCFNSGSKVPWLLILMSMPCSVILFCCLFFAAKFSAFLYVS